MRLVEDFTRKWRHTRHMSAVFCRRRGKICYRIGRAVHFPRFCDIRDNRGIRRFSRNSRSSAESRGIRFSSRNILFLLYTVPFSAFDKSRIVSYAVIFAHFAESQKTDEWNWFFLYKRNDWLLNADLHSDSYCIYVKFVTNFKAK